MPKIKANGIQIYYEEYGHGEPLIFISGFSADHSIWLSFVREYAQSYRTIIFDNRGVGQSDCPDYQYKIGMMVEDLVEICRVLNIEQANFIGHSMGGAILQNLAYTNPGMVKSAVLVNSFSHVDLKFILFSKSQLEYMKLGIPPKFLIQSVLSQLYSSRFLAQEGTTDTLISLMSANPYLVTAKGYENQLAALIDFDSRAWISKISCPCLVIGSDEDIIVFEKDTKALAEAMPNAQYYCFKGGIGHMPFIEQPKAFNSSLLSFLAKH